MFSMLFRAVYRQEEKGEEADEVEEVGWRRWGMTRYMVRGEVVMLGRKAEVVARAGTQDAVWLHGAHVSGLGSEMLASTEDRAVWAS